MRQLVAQRLRGVARIGPNQNGPAAGKRDACTPGGRAAPAQLVHACLIGNHDQPKGAGIAEAEPGPAQRAIGVLGERDGERKLARPGNGGDLPDLDRARLALQDEGECC